MFWPILPDLLIFAVAGLAGRGWWRVCLAAAAGSVAGGIGGFALSWLRGSSAPLEYLPLVTEGMIHQAGQWLASEGSIAVLRQPLSGIPYKVFVYLSGSGRTSFTVFVLASVVARTGRLLVIGGVSALLFAVAGAARAARWYLAFLAALTIVFSVGLWRVVASFPAP